MLSARRCCLPWLLLCWMSLPGCGPKRPETSPVSGRVTCAGKPVVNGWITFHPAKGRPSYGRLRPDGTYTLTTFSTDDGASLGKHHVTIEAFRGPDLRMPKSPEEEKGHPLPRVNDTIVWLVPEKYARESTSPLTAEVVRGGNKIDFDLP
jgi:hypothetical protein